MAELGIVVSRETWQGGKIGRLTSIQVMRGQKEYRGTHRHDLASEEDEKHMEIMIKGEGKGNDWKQGIICLPTSIAIPLAKAMLSVAEYTKTQEIVLPD